MLDPRWRPAGTLTAYNGHMVRLNYHAACCLRATPRACGRAAAFRCRARSWSKAASAAVPGSAPTSTVHYCRRVGDRGRHPAARRLGPLHVAAGGGRGCGSTPKCNSTSCTRRGASNTSSRSANRRRDRLRASAASKPDWMPANETRRSTRKSCRKLQVRLCHLQALGQGEGPARRRHLRGARRRRQGRHDPRDHRAGQPARVPRRRAAGAVGPREEPGLHAALPAALPGGGRGRHLRSQLVQPRRRRARHGLLHARRSISGSWSCVRRSRRSWSTAASC